MDFEIVNCFYSELREKGGFVRYKRSLLCKRMDSKGCGLVNILKNCIMQPIESFSGNLLHISLIFKPTNE